MSTLSLFIIIVPILVTVLLVVNLLLAVHRPDSEKVTPFECGIESVTNQTRAQFSIAYYLVGVLFLVMDIELFVSYPYIAGLYNLQGYGFWVFLAFFGILTLGFVYEIASGALYFTDQRSKVKLPLKPTGL